MERLRLTGFKVNGITALRPSRLLPRKLWTWIFRCHCGRKFETQPWNVMHGHTKSCGCFRVNRPNKRTHGYAGKNRIPEYGIWKAMKARCSNPHVKGWKNYGGRGIRVCKRWRHSFPNFLADMGRRPRNRSIDRIDNDGNYTPKNCRWATQKQQVANQRKMRREAEEMRSHFQSPC